MLYFFYSQLRKKFVVERKSLIPPAGALDCVPCSFSDFDDLDGVFI